jgi:hypothetical protein
MRTSTIVAAFARLACAVVFVWTASAATLANADTAKSVRVAAGELTVGIEALAEQCGVDVIYDPGLVKGQKTQGVAGALQPTEAFRKLLDGTGLDIQEEGSALLITKAGSTPLLGADRFDTLARDAAVTPPEPKYQVTVAAARQESLSTLYPRLESLKSEFYAAYNQANDDPRYEVRCKRGEVHLEANLLVLGVVCSPQLKITCSGGDASTNRFCTAWPPKGYCEHLFEVVARHPKLREMLKEYDALAVHYGEVRGEKLKDKIPNDSVCGPRASLPR